MSNPWPTRCLGDIFDIARGGSPRPIEKYITSDPAGLNWVKIGDASASGKFIEKTKEKIKPEGLSKTRQVRPGDFLLTNSMSFGRPYIMATDGCIHDGWLVLHPIRDELVDTEYFYHLLGSKEVYSKFAARAGGSTVKNLNTEIVSSIEIPLPPLDEQRRIAAILDKADALRRKRKRALDLLDGLTQSIFDTVFGDVFDCNDDPPVSLEDLADIQIGYPFKSAEYAEGGECVRLCRGANVLPGRMDWSDLAQWPTSREGEFSEYRLKVGDIVLAMDRPWISSGFKVAQIATADLPALLVQRVARIRARRPDDSAFLSQLIKHPRISGHFKPTETTIPHISPKEIRAFRFRLPSTTARRQFSNQITSLRRAIDSSMTTMRSSENLFASLQHRAFTGQL